MFLGKKKSNDAETKNKDAKQLLQQQQQLKPFTLAKSATSEHSKNGAQFLLSKRPAQPISEQDLEEFQREEKEGREAKLVQVAGNALIVISFIVNWWKKRREEAKRRKREEEEKAKEETPPTIEES